MTVNGAQFRVKGASTCKNHTIPHTVPIDWRIPPSIELEINGEKKSFEKKKYAKDNGIEWKVEEQHETMATKTT